MKAFRSILCLFLTVVLVVSLIPGGFAVSGDKETTKASVSPNGRYYFHYGWAPYHDIEAVRYQYYSPYMPLVKVETVDGPFTIEIPIYIRNMYNADTGETVPVYSIDLPIGSESIYTTAYPRDLEAVEYTAEAAGLIRAIVQEGFYLPHIPDETAENHEARVAAKLRALGEAVGIPDLTVGEAIAATQMAVWKTFYEDRISYLSLVEGENTPSSGDIRHYSLCSREKKDGHYQTENGEFTEASKAYLNNRVEVLYDYLMNLTPVKLGENMITADCIKSLEVCGYTADEEGYFIDIHLKVTVDVDLEEGEQLMLKVALGSGGYSDTVELVDGEQQISMTIEHAYYTMGTSLTYPYDIDVFHVTIWGAQYDARAVLFTSLRASEGNIRVGFDDGLVPIYFETTVPNVHVPETVPSVPPTCVDYGLTKSQRCTVCGLELSDQAEIVPTGHTLVDGSCIHCDYRQPEEDYAPADPYVFHYDVEGNAYEGYNHQYFSPYITRYAYNDGERGGISTIFQHSMYNAVTGDVIPTYCMDIFTGVYSDTAYRRLNIDDSTNYTAGWNADLLRAIMLGGFYLAPVQGETMEEHEARVQDKLQILRDATGISDLTVGEAIAATQLAIWKAAHGEKLVFESMVHSIYAYASNQPSLFQYYDLCNEERQNGHYEIKGGFLTAESKAYLTQRIETLYHYLLALPPVETNSEIIANNHGVSSYNKHCIRNTDGTYDVHLKIYVFDYEWNPEGSFTLTAYIDAAHYVQAEVLPGVHSYNMVLKNVPEESLYNRETGEIGKVTVALDGTQVVSDVVLYEARGGAEFSQSMLGMDNSRVPVHSEITENITRVKEYVNLDMSHSVSLGSNIAINYIISREKIGNFSECYFYCFVGDEVVCLEPKLRGDYAYFTYDGLTAVNINDEILAWLYYTQGEMESEYDLGRYSVATYAYSMLNKEGIPEQAKRVCANLLRYGSAVQRFKDYKVDDLPDGKLTEEQRGYLTDLDTVEFAEPYKILKDVTDPTVKWAGRSMSLESTIALKQVIDISNYPGDPTALELRMSYRDVRGEEKLVTLNPTLYNEEHQLYAFTVTQLNAADLRSTLTCQVFAEGKPVSQTMVYSPDSYGNRKTGVMLELCQALFAYVDCAKAFFAG